MKNIIFLYILGFILITSCKPKQDDFKPSSGDANFSKYVALGNSLTAGYADGALYITGQKNSYPNILAQQFKLVGGGDFKIPFVADEKGIAFSDAGQPITKRILKFKADCLGQVSLTPDTSGPADLAANIAYIGAQGPFNNMGVPGAKSFHLSTPLFGKPGTGNPFYTRFASNPGTSTVVQDAVSQNPTFFTLWIGSNDVLLYSISGGEDGQDSVTNPFILNLAISGTVDALTAGGAKGAIANIPDITNIPFFSTVPYNGLVLTNPTDVTNLNLAYTALGIKFHLGQNPFIIEDPTAIGGVRQINSTEFILLTIPQDSLKCKKWGSAKPIPAKYVLDDTELGKVQTATTDYNIKIANIAASKNLALVDINSLLKNLQSGISFDGIHLNAKFVTGGAFSLDGIHLTPRGNAAVANEFINAINSKYSSNIPLVNVSDYPGVKFP